MKSIIKKVAIASCLGCLSLAGGIVVLNIQDKQFVRAEDVFVGNHYTGVDATFSTPGIKEYWINCSTHEVTFTQPSDGNYKDAGEAKLDVSTLDSDDPRIVPQMSASEVPSIKEILDVHADLPTFDYDKKQNVKVVDGNNKETGLIIKDVTESGQQPTENTDFIVVDYVGDDEVVIIPDCVTRIEGWKNAFNGEKNEHCEQIETIVIQSSVEKLGHQTFWNLPNLKTLVIDAKEIEQGFVYDCPNLETVFISDKVEKIGGGIFTSVGTKKDLKIYMGLTESQVNKELNKNISGQWNVKADWNARYAANYGITF